MQGSDYSRNPQKTGHLKCLLRKYGPPPHRCLGSRGAVVPQRSDLPKLGHPLSSFPKILYPLSCPGPGSPDPLLHPLLLVRSLWTPPPHTLVGDFPPAPGGAGDSPSLGSNSRVPGSCSCLFWVFPLRTPPSTERVPIVSRVGQAPQPRQTCTCYPAQQAY